MKRYWKRTLLFALALAVALLPALALADAETDGAGNVFATDGSASGMTIAGDLYGAGQQVDASGAKIAESAILAGQYVYVNNSTIGGSLRAACYTLSAADTAVDANATLAARSISLGREFSAKGIYIAAQTVDFAGECDTLNVMAQTVTISGIVNGDANISAETVTVADTAVITGTLHVTADSEPVVPAGATVGSVQFTKGESDSDDAVDSESAVSVAAGAVVLHKVLSFAKSLLGGLGLAVLYYFIIQKTIEDAAAMVKTRPAAMPVSGFITLISLPVAVIILFITVVGASAGALLLCLYGLALGFASSFAGCMLGKLFFPKLHTLLAYIIGVAGISLLKVIPFLGGLVTLGCMIYTLGYFIQKIYLGFTKKKSEGGEPVQAVAEAEPQPETV